MGKNKKGKGAKSKSVYKCEVCNGTEADRPVVACDKCDKWHHFSCVGLTSIGKNDDWVCEKCEQQDTSSVASSQSIQTAITKQSQNLILSSGLLTLTPRYESTTLPSNQQPKAITKPTRNEFELVYDRNHPGKQPPKPTESRTTCSISQATQSSGRKRIELQKLEEQRELKELRDQRYLEEKYRILNERYSSDTGTEKSHVSRTTYTKNWVKNQDPEIREAETIGAEFDSTKISQVKKKLEDLQLGSTFSHKSINIDRCDICFMTGNKIDFTVCCTCKEIGHRKCMSKILIDEELWWICPKCKGPSHYQDENRFYHSTKSLQDTPMKTKIQDSSLKPFNRLYCFVCRIVDDEKLFGKCCLCVKRCHHTCMDIMQIDHEDYWICPDCKSISMESKLIKKDKEQHSEISTSIKKPTFKSTNLRQSKPIPIIKETPDNNTHRCEQCGKVNGKLPIVACDICDKWYHYECIKLASIDGKVLWICSKCKGPEKASKEFESHQAYPFDQSHILKPVNRFSQISQPFTNTKKEEPSTGIRQFLTNTQIASRHVVTKDLPIFAGKPEQWPMFLSRFRNSTELCGYSDSENLDRLQKCLKGNALEAVRSRLLTAESVPEIMKTLEMLYGRPELIVNSLMKKIRSEPPPKADKLNTLIDFALSVKNVCATLEQANLDYHLSNPALIQELVEKLPTNFKIEWAKHKANIQNVTLSTLGNFLYNLAEVISTVTEPTLVQEPKYENKKKDSNQKESTKKDSDTKDPSHVYAHQFQSKRNTFDSQSDTKGKSTSTQCKICDKTCRKVENCPVFRAFDVDRRWNEMYKQKLCRKCLERHGKFCGQAKVCGVDNCIFKHHSLLHDVKRHSKEAIEQRQLVADEKVLAVEKRNNNTHFTTLRIVLLRIVPVTLYAKDKTIQTFAYQDDGSDITLIEESLIEDLEINGKTEQLCLLWTGEIHRKENNSRRVDLEISGQGDFSQRYSVRDVRTVQTLGLPIQSVISAQLQQEFPYLKDALFIDYDNAVPRMLIGSDNAHLNLPIDVIEGEFYQPIACKTRIGWSVHGRTDRHSTKETEKVVNVHRNKCPCQHSIDQEMHQLIKEHFSIENFGVQIVKNLQLCSKEDERALELLNKYTRRVDNRYETALLWKYDQITLPNSYGMAYKRLQCLEKHKPETVGVITNTIEEYLRKGYVYKLTDEDLHNSNNARIWYLPIFTVTYPKKPDKIRVVFDGAAKVEGVSLNSLLLKGPDQLSSLVDILRRFREKKVAAVGDITEMFPQIKIRREDIHVQRFLWRNGDQSKVPEQYVLSRMTFGANCSPASAQFVKNKNASEFESEYPRAVESIIKNHYVDDMLDCQHSDIEMIQLINDVKKIHSHGGFEIRKFLSNSTAVMKEFNQNDDGSIQTNIDMSFGTERVLGMWWNTRKDCLTFSLKYTKIDPDIVSGKRRPTKRELLKILMSIYDPLGFLSHYLIHLKIIIQDIWRSNLDWDEEISSNDTIIAWNRWLKLLPNVEKVEIPRLYSMKMSPDTPKSIELHVFVDAGDKAFSAVAYLRVENEEEVADCTLVGSKSRVTPLKYMSTPRNELQAAILGSRLMRSIVNAQTFNIDRCQFWTDSNTVLSWIHSDNRKYHQFVAHRIGEIIENTNLNDWRWIPSKQNVADEATKWSKPPSFENTDRWFTGPDFLKLPRNEWPSTVQIKPDTSEEMKVHFVHSNLIVPSIIDPTNISSWNKLHRALAYVVRYISILKAKVKKEIVKNGPLTRDELIASEILLFRQAQFQDFTEEMVLLMRNQSLPIDQQKYVHQSSLLYNCTPYLDENGVIRLHGRIDSAEDVAFASKRPIILPRNNRITRLLVAHYHEQYHHRNHRTVYNEIRQRFFIPSLRVVLNSVRSECQRCKNKRARAQPPQMADLPPARLAIGFRAFSFVGIDYFGPVYVVIGRRSEKRWGVLITCMTVRAVHVELAYHLDTQSCIMCIRNFICLRGCPQEIFSDQGTNMKGMDNTLKKLVSELDVNLMASEFTTCYTKWNFNPPASPHMGGAWESMVKSVKSCLFDILPTRNPTEDMLRNLILEVCNIINSRPLTYIPIEHEESDILTPNHFILGSSNGLKPIINIHSDGPILYSKWMENQRLTDIFWAKFVKEFLPDLTRRTKWHEPVQPIQVDDIVLLVDGTNVRGQYPMARVIETSIGSNNQVRQVRIQRFSNEGSKLKESILWRPATSLAKLDVHKKDCLSAPTRDRQTEGSVSNVNTDPVNTTAPDSEN